ncbi:MAG: D-2-hydroxyacid dehydrogenase [Gemmataceae bacterium]|nr:D-2-hydroxyacid dehydrogenase [Gemmataceae bacterium]
MNAEPLVLVLAWMPEGVLPRLAAQFPEVTWVDAREPAALERHLGQASITYGLPPVSRLDDAPGLRWIQLISAGVPQDLCPAASKRGITVTNLSGLYGPSIAEHALALMVLLARNLHVVLRNQQQRRWDRTVANTMSDLQGRTLAIVGLGNIGRSIARLARAYGMRVVGCRRTDVRVPEVDRLYCGAELHAMLAEADFVAVATPLTARTEGLLGPAEFAAMKPGVIYINVSRGAVAQEPALLAALHSGQVAAAGLDVYATEPLLPDHPLWEMPQVIVSPHYCGETINLSSRPAERLARNLRAWLAGQELEGVVDLEWGY